MHSLSFNITFNVLRITLSILRYAFNQKFSQYANIRTYTKFPGNDFPSRIYRQAPLRYQDSFLLLGGYSCEDSGCNDGCDCPGPCTGITDTIYKLVRSIFRNNNHFY